MRTHELERTLVVACGECGSCAACVRRALGAWLSRYPWSWYVTLTFPFRIHPEAAAKTWRVFLRELPPARWVRALEYQKRGVIHYHALTWFGGAGEPRRLTAMDRWTLVAGGYARIVSYDPDQGAGYYLGKYVAKGGEVDLGGAWWTTS